MCLEFIILQKYNAKHLRCRRQYWYHRNYMFNSSLGKLKIEGISSFEIHMHALVSISYISFE